MAYATVSELRDEGVADPPNDARLTRLLGFATKYIDKITGRFFEVRSLTLLLDGRGGRILQLNIPIIELTKLRVDVGPLAPGFVDVDLDLVRVYNRHLSQGLVSPDDRENPRIEFYHGADILGRPPPSEGLLLTNLVFPAGQQNITVEGRFGYTDPDDVEADGVTPEAINHVAKLLVLREIHPMASADDREDATKRWRIKSEKTRDQSYTLDSLHLRGVYTGDPEIDQILAMYTRPPDFGAA